MPKIAILLPSNDDIPIPTMLSILSLYAYLSKTPLYSDAEDENDVNIYSERSSLLVGSRQNLMQRALDADNEWILMLDSDMTFPPDIVHRLASRGKPLIACNYVKRVVPSIPITKDFDDNLVFTDPDTTGLQKVKFTGFGVCLLHRSIFDDFPKPWFDTQWMRQEDGEIFLVGEDVFFFQALRHFKNVDIYIDHDLSQSVTHIGQFEYHNRLGKASIEEFENEQNKNS